MQAIGKAKLPKGFLGERKAEICVGSRSLPLQYSSFAPSGTWMHATWEARGVSRGASAGLYACGYRCHDDGNEKRRKRQRESSTLPPLAAVALRSVLGQSLLEFSSIVFFAARGCGRSRDLGFGSEQTDTKNPSGFGAGARIRALQVTPHSRAARRETTNPARALRKNFNVPAHEDRDASICNVVSLVYVCAHERLSCEKNWRQRLRLDARFSVVALDHHRQN